MAYDKQKVVDIALSEVGYLEKASTSNLDDKTANAGSGNYTKYSRDLAKYPYFNGRKQGVAWCAVFVAWCFVQAYGKDAALKLLCQPTKPANNAGAGCKYARNYFKNKGQLYTSDPQPGDMIFFYSKDKSQIQHTGLVYKADSSKVYTIEGNTSGASGVVANGGGVCKKSYSLGYERLAGYGRPAYGNTSSVTSTKQDISSDTSSVSSNTSSNTSTSYTTYTVKKGDSLWKIAKKLLGSGSKYPKIQKANGLSKDLIRVGQKLKIPKG